jgi:Uncharacterized conserved protein
LQLKMLESAFSVVKLSPADPIPSWATSGSFFSVTRTDEELSIVVPSESLPPDEVFGNIENDFRCIKIEEGVLDFSLTGILASVAGPLADAGISIFAIATYNTDDILIKSRSLEKAKSVLELAGHTFIP